MKNLFGLTRTRIDKKCQIEFILVLKKCREIGYLAFIEEAKEKVANGWRTWQIISKDMVFTNAMKN